MGSKAERNRLAVLEDNRRVLVDELQPLYERSEFKEISQIWIIRDEDNGFNKMRELS